jgi:hypothetical protein
MKARAAASGDRRPGQRQIASPRSWLRTCSDLFAARLPQTRSSFFFLFGGTDVFFSFGYFLEKKSEFSFNSKTFLPCGKRLEALNWKTSFPEYFSFQLAVKRSL